jgi:hypothetical protein
LQEPSALPLRDPASILCCLCSLLSRWNVRTCLLLVNSGVRTWCDSVYLDTFSAARHMYLQPPHAFSAQDSSNKLLFTRITNVDVEEWEHGQAAWFWYLVLCGGKRLRKLWSQRTIHLGVPKHFGMVGGGGAPEYQSSRRACLHPSASHGLSLLTVFTPVSNLPRL